LIATGDEPCLFWRWDFNKYPLCKKHAPPPPISSPIAISSFSNLKYPGIENTNSFFIWFFFYLFWKKIIEQIKIKIKIKIKNQPKVVLRSVVFDWIWWELNGSFSFSFLRLCNSINEFSSLWPFFFFFFRIFFFFFFQKIIK